MTQTAFSKQILTTNNGRFIMEFIVYYNYNQNDGSFTNSELICYNVPLENFSCNSVVEVNTSSGLITELNTGNQTMFKYTNDMYDIDVSNSDPNVLYQYIINNLL